MTDTLAKRKAAVIECLVNNRTNSRMFDNCFENGDGDLVVEHILKYVDGYSQADYDGDDLAKYKSAKRRKMTHQTLMERGYHFYTQREHKNELQLAWLPWHDRRFA